MQSYYEAEDGAKIYYQSHGDPANPTIVCTAGLFCGADYWRLQVPTLIDDGYHVLTIALRGHGASRDQPLTRSLLDHCERDVSGILEQVCNKESYTWMGHSMGGAVSMYFAIHHPELVERLIILNTSYVLESSLMNTPIWRAASFVSSVHDTMPSLTGSLLHFVRHSLRLFYRVPKRDLRLIAEDVLLFSGEATIRELEELGKYDLEADLPTITMPTLIIAGARDPLTPAYRSRIMHQRIPNSELKVVSGGHYVNILSSARINRILHEFLTRARDGEPVLQPTTHRRFHGHKRERKDAYSQTHARTVHVTDDEGPDPDLVHSAI